MEPRGVPGVPVEFDAGLNRPLGHADDVVRASRFPVSLVASSPFTDFRDE